MDPSTNQPAQPIPSPNVVPVPPAAENRPQVPTQPSAETQPGQPTVEVQPAAIEATPRPGSAMVPDPQLQPTTAPAQLTSQAATLPAQTVHVGSVAGRQLHDPSLANLSAGDDDLIEKEWVDKAEEVIEENQDNPRAEDDQQHEMSQTYLKKRFNLDVS